MERELTVKVNYVLGDQSAFTDAASHAEGVNKKIAASGESFLSRFQSGLGAMGGAAMRMAAGGLGGMLGVGTIGAIAGNINSDLMTGGGLRGHGLSGLGDSFMGMVMGRGTREAMIDINKQQGEYIAAQRAGQVSSFMQQTDVMRGTAYGGVTEVDPVRRIEAERELMQQKDFHAKFDFGRLKGSHDASIAEMRLHHDKLGDNSVQGKAAREMDLARINNVFLENQKNYLMGALQRQTEINNLDKQVFESRKAAMREGKMQWGGMTLAQQQSTKISLDLLKNKQPLMPEQIAQLHGIPEAKEALDEYLLKQGKEGGYGAAVAGLKGDMGRANAMSEGVKSSTGLDIDPENFLEAGSRFELTNKLKKFLGEGLAEIIAGLEGGQQWGRENAQRLMQERQKTGDLR